ncbi:MAG: hypothetical protein H6500_00515 [Candidatus Woesearchaeota archaeon]|nr:hypothetical protein [Nanoarchaeota archaeon]USN44315.1 MAG: hypothetical protein H6500_00515 [Candidatus Woesearchaeota archaeon]
MSLEERIEQLNPSDVFSMTEVFNKIVQAQNRGETGPRFSDLQILGIYGNGDGAFLYTVAYKANIDAQSFPGLETDIEQYLLTTYVLNIDEANSSAQLNSGTLHALYDVGQKAFMYHEGQEDPKDLASWRQVQGVQNNALAFIAYSSLVEAAYGIYDKKNTSFVPVYLSPLLEAANDDKFGSEKKGEG